MKKNLFGFTTVAALLAMPLASTATTFFADTFGSGSTLNQPPTMPTTNSASYQTAGGVGLGACSLSPGRLSYSLTNSESVLGEVMGMFTDTSSPIVLATAGDNLTLTVVFTNTLNILAASNSSSSTLNIGLYYTGTNTPNQGNIILNLGNISGGSQFWVGYFSKIFVNSGSSAIYTRAPQLANGTTSQNQDLLFNNASSTQAFNNPGATSLGTTTGGAILANGAVYTETLSITLNAANQYGVTNTLYAGAGTGGTALFTQGQTTSGSTYVTGGFNALAIGWRNTSTAAQVSTMDISSIAVSSSIFVAPPPPPVPVVVATNGSCALSVSFPGFGLTYQWHRNGTNLLDGGNISGANSAMLIISSAGTDDVCSGSNSYYLTITGPGGYSTNSTRYSLALCPVANLVWSGDGSDWDVATSSSWLNGGISAVFNYGDNVTFDDTADTGYRNVNLSGTYLSAGLVTVSNAVNYTFAGSGSIAGPGALIYMGSGPLILSGVNSYSGGTIISNAAADLVLSNYSALGNGPVTFARAGGTMEVVPAGNASTGIKGDVMVADDFTIQFDGNGAFSGVIFGNLSGTAGKTLTLMPQNDGTTNRFRFYGTNTVCNANLILHGTATSQAIYNGTVLAPYESSGSQTYNGIISGNGGLVQRGSGTTILNGANTYSGGTTPTAGTIAFGTDTIGAVVAGPIGTGPLFLSPEVLNATGSGQVMAWNGPRTIANPIQYPSATNNLTLIIGGTNALTFTGPITLNGNDGNGTSTNRIFQVTNTALTIFSGVISDGGFGFGLTKTGNSVLALNNTETYSGLTVVSNGTLQVNGTLDAASPVMVGANGILAGTGTVNGTVAVDAGGTLAPGASIGTLTLNGGLILKGNLRFKVNKSLSPQSNDVASVSGTLTNIGSGFLAVSNLGPALVVGDTFHLFNRPLTNGAALTVAGGGPGVAWNNQLATDGSISVASVTNSNPGMNIAITTGTNVVISGTGAPAGANYSILYQTNLAMPLTNWILIYSNTFLTGGAFSITVTNAFSTGITNRFFIFRMPE